MFKSIAVVVGSYVLSVVLVIATDPLLSLIFPDYVRGRVPSSSVLLASTAFFVVISVLCAWLCARFAPSRAARHVLWFLIIGEVMGVVSIIPNWNKGWPHWYWLSWLLTWPVSCWIGLALGRRRTESVAG
jgi:O-antigen/teichoic acid export membrane protein